LNTNKGLHYFNNEYENILHSELTEDSKALKYSHLMTEMEQVYKIPIIKDKLWEKENKAVIAMYRKISMSRNI